MSPIDSSRVKRIAAELAGLPAGERGPFLERACLGDTALRLEVESLLAALDSPTAGASNEHTLDAARSPAATGGERHGTWIGPYKLLKQIGEGGFGSVFLADQEKPVRRQVALKIIKLGMDTGEVIARFEQERQALAIMEHPNIARVLDAGATETGRPYFVMEFVRGQPITEFCDANNLPLRDRLELVVKVCGAVQHAHQKGLIHRDIKPSNILVDMEDGKPSPKVIDFGIAKATGQKLTERTMFTELGQFIGTPAYMSPEQAEGSLDIDTRSDIYALGVVLYELLTGVTPFDTKSLRRAAFDEIRRIIREEEPKKPSTRAGTVSEEMTAAARSRGVEPGKLKGILKGDLDWIVMKALEKDRQRRYETATGLGMDIQRYLAGEAVAAAPPSASYRMRKFVTRHRTPVLAATASVVVLIGFAIAMALQARKIEAEREASENVSAFLANMLGGARPEAMGASLWKGLHEGVAAARKKRGESQEQVAQALAALDQALAGVDATQTALGLLDQEILEKAGRTIEKEMGKDPRIAGRLENTLAATYDNLGLYEAAEKHARRAVEIRERAFGVQHPDTLVSHSQLASVFQSQGRLPDAESLARRTLDAQRRIVGKEHAQTLSTLNLLALTLQEAGKYAESEELFRLQFEIRSRVRGASHPDTLIPIQNLAIVYRAQGKYPEAERLYTEAYRTWKQGLGPEHPHTLMAMNNLANIYGDQGRLAEAAKVHREALDIRRRVFGANHPLTAQSINSLAVVLSGQGEYREAEALHREALEVRLETLGPDHPSTLDSMNNLASIFYSQGQFAKAAKLHKEALKAKQRVLGAEHPNTLVSMSNLASCLYGQGLFDEAAQLHRETLEGRRRVLAPGHPHVLWSLFSLACAYDSLGRFMEALELAREAQKGYESRNLEKTSEAGNARLAAGRALLGLNRLEEAEAELLAAEPLIAPGKGPNYKECLEALAALYENRERIEPGKGHHEKAEAWKQKLAGDPWPGRP